MNAHWAPNVCNKLRGRLLLLCPLLLSLGKQLLKQNAAAAARSSSGGAVGSIVPTATFFGSGFPHLRLVGPHEQGDISE
eukprot:SAG31_NODE_4700_length_3024_cov_2.572308_4_plen_79_part_00